MKPGAYTWDTLDPIDGNLLVVINSPDDGGEQVDALLTALERNQPAAAVHVIAPAQWQSHLAAKGIAGNRVLIARDVKGGDVDVNHFLESPEVVLWSVARQFRLMVGTDAHNLYNEEVKDVFEQRMLLLLGDGQFLAHTLPIPYVYVLEVAHLVERCGRDVKVRAYEASSRALIDDLHRLWVESGSPARKDDPDYSDVMQVMERRMGPALLAFDEVSAIPLPPERIGEPVAAVVKNFLAVLAEHDRHLEAMTALHAERSQAVVVREELLAERLLERNEAVATRERINQQLVAERNEAVTLRDGIISDLRAEMDQRLVRVALKIMRRLRPSR